MKKIFTVLTVLFASIFISCSTVPNISDRVPANKDSNINQEKPVTYESHLNFPLYKNERYYNGTKEAELASFLEGGQRVLKAQQKIAESVKDKTGNNDKKRVFHTKQQGCYYGKLNLLQERPSDTAGETFTGMFDPRTKESYDVLVRFSNGVGIQQDDKLPDVRGMAIKVIDVMNSKTGKPQSVDFLMTNSPTPFGKDFLEFVEFMDYVADHGPTWGAILFTPHFRASRSLIKASGLPVIANYKIKSLATQRYWSGHPYLLGNDKAMKFNVRPTETKELTTKEIKKMGPNAPNYLSIDLNERLKNRSIKFKFAIQLEKDSKSTPIEDNLIEWKEKTSPSIEVADLIIEQQYDPHTGELFSACETMRFTPGHYIPEHRPLSNMGRGRLFAYEASQIGRQESDNRKKISYVPGQEPTAQDLARWRSLNVK